MIIEREYKNFFVVYKEGKLTLFDSALKDNPLKEVNVKISNERDFEIETMWVVEEYERAQTSSDNWT